jgi:tight adherence protein B
VAVMGLGLLVGSVAVGLGSGGLWAIGSLGLLRSRAETVRRRADDQLAPFLEAIARELRAGSSLRTALGVVSDASPPPLGPAVRRLATATRQGAPLPSSLDRWATVQATPASRLAGAALALAAELGGAPARSLDGVAASLRHHAAIQGEAHALGAQARASAMVLVFAPVAFTSLMANLDGEIGRFLFHTPAGLACLFVGSGLDLLGAFWMHRITTAVTA